MLYECRTETCSFFSVGHRNQVGASLKLGYQCLGMIQDKLNPFIKKKKHKSLLYILKLEDGGEGGMV